MDRRLKGIQRQQLATDLAAYLSQGGTITQIPIGQSGNLDFQVLSNHEAINRSYATRQPTQQQRGRPI